MRVRQYIAIDSELQHLLKLQVIVYVWHGAFLIVNTYTICMPVQIKPQMKVALLQVFLDGFFFIVFRMHVMIIIFLLRHLGSARIELILKATCH